MLKVIDIDTVKDRLAEKHNGTIVLLEYTKSKIHAKFKCLVCGNEWNGYVSNIINKGSGCPLCSAEKLREDRRFSDEYVREYINSEECKWVSGKYNNSFDKIEILFKCGHSGFISFDNFKHGVRCSICGRIQGNKTRTTSEYEIIENVRNAGFVFIDFPNGYINGHSVMRYSCSFGHITEKRCSCFYNCPRCSICAKNKRGKLRQLTHDEIKNIVESKGCILISDDTYDGVKSKILILFSCGHEGLVKISNFSTRVHGDCNNCYALHNIGKNAPRWENGLTKISAYLRISITDWYKKSLELNNYKCYITGLPAQTVHHLFPFHKIIKIVFKNLNMRIEETVSGYTEQEIIQIQSELLKIHNSYPLGISLTKKVHNLFHNIYGRKNFTPEQFYEFQSKILSGEIII